MWEMQQDICVNTFELNLPQCILLHLRLLHYVKPLANKTETTPTIKAVTTNSNSVCSPSLVLLDLSVLVLYYIILLILQGVSLSLQFCVCLLQLVTLSISHVNL